MQVKYIFKMENLMSGCIMCGNEDLERFPAEFVPFLQERMFQNKKVETFLCHCPTCGFYYSSVRPSDEEMSRLYNGYRGEAYQKQRQKFESNYTEAFNHALGFSEENEILRNSIMLGCVKKYISPSCIKTILDYGGDSGQYIPRIFKKAEKFVYDVSGVKTVRGVKSVSDERVLKNCSWDLIMCCHVLEHVSYPLDLIEKLKSLMHHGSFLYIELPYEDYMEDFIKQGLPVPIHEHINAFRKETLEQAFGSDEFFILENEYVSGFDTDGSACSKYLRCLVKKADPTEFPELEKMKSACKNLSDTAVLGYNVVDKITALRKRQTLKEKIFSVKKVKKHRVIEILGIKMKFNV